MAQVDSVPGSRRDAARALHRAGRLDQARAEYERLLTSEPEDAELLRLLGVVASQQTRAKDAEELLRRALRAPNADPRIHLQNLNNLFILLKDRGRGDAARALAGSDVPDWPENARPDAAQRSTVLSLCAELANIGHPDRALSLLDSVLHYLGGDAEAIHLAGRLRLMCQGAEAALLDLEMARRLDPGNWQILAALGQVYDVLDNRPAARKAENHLARAAPVYLAARRDGQEATILVLNRTPRKIANTDHGLHGLHFTKNYISQASRVLADRFRFASVFADLPDPPPELPDADVVFNNVASGEMMRLPGYRERVEELLLRIGRPVINHPRAVAQMTRRRVSAGLQSIPGLRVPRIDRYRRNMEQFDEIEAEIATNIAYPAIIRQVAADESSRSLISASKTAILVHSADELRGFLNSVNWTEFYAIEYVDLRKPDGNFRKLRAACFPDEVIITSANSYSEWMVGGWRSNQQGQSFYEAFPHLLAEMTGILTDPQTILGPQVMPVLEAVRDRVPLDVFGVDFDVDESRQVILFEADATMLFLPVPGIPGHLRLPQELGDRVNAAFCRLARGKMPKAEACQHGHRTLRPSDRGDPPCG